MAREVIALQQLDGQGVPRVLEENTRNWKDDSAPLYIVMEWRDGHTLGQVVDDGPLGIDQAVSVIDQLSSIVERFHTADILHRDLKPDNILFKGEGLAAPYIVDFGLAAGDEVQEATFATNSGEDLGSRFLHLPELMPGPHRVSIVSDITLLVGLLFYCVTGIQPVQLRNEQNQSPQEALAARIPADLISDPRWTRLVRVFNVGFEPDVSRRFQTIEEFRARVTSVLHESDSDDVEGVLREQVEEVAALLSAAEVRVTDELIALMTRAHRRFIATFDQALPSGMVDGGSGPNPTFGGSSVETHFYVARGSMQELRVSYDILTEANGSGIKASYHVEGSQWVPYYSDSNADEDSLSDATEVAAKKCCSLVLAEFAAKFRRTRGQQRIPGQ